ncbi:hypothetical protein Tco_0304145 [Tanacetum coccineum]
MEWRLLAQVGLQKQKGDERGGVVINKARLVGHGNPQERRSTSQAGKGGSSYLTNKYVAAILKKFDLVTPKTSHLHAVKRIFQVSQGKNQIVLWYPRKIPLLIWKHFSASGLWLIMDERKGMQRIDAWNWILKTNQVDHGKCHSEAVRVENKVQTLLEAAKISQRLLFGVRVYWDQGRRYRDRKRHNGKKVVSRLDFQEELMLVLNSTGGDLVVMLVKIKTKRKESSHDTEETPQNVKGTNFPRRSSLAEAIRLDS